MSSQGGGLKRRLGVLDVASLGLNGVIGSGIFLLPGIVAGLLGPAAILAYLLAAGVTVLIALCFAEVGSRFTGTGGPYLYAREAFGSFMGFEVGWMTWWVRVISWGALANAFTITLSHFVPAVETGLVQKLVIVLVMATFTGINIVGVKAGAMVTNFFTAAKLVPLVVFVAVGLFFVSGERFAPFAPEGYGSIGEATLVILYAFVGFEVLTVPGGEMRDPQRSVPRALLLVMALVSVVYLGVQIVASGTFSGLPGSENPVAEASVAFMGPLGGTFIAVGIFVSVVGVNAGSALITPRCLYALAEGGQMPPLFARVHSRFGTPVIAILISSVLSCALALTGSFEELAVISVVARFVQYVPTCIALVVLRRRVDPQSRRTGFRVPLGPVIPAVAVLLSLWLLAEAGCYKLLVGAGAFVSGIPFYIWFRRRGQGAPRGPRDTPRDP